MELHADYGKFFLNEQLSDISVVILDETEPLGKRKRDKTLPAHSKYFETKLLSWSGAGAASRSNSKNESAFEVELPVPAGQQDLAELLIKGIYQKQPCITADLSHEQLLQLLLLADRFQVPKVQAAVLQAFIEVPAEQLHWQTALNLLDLPAVCAEQPDQFKTLQDLAVKRLLHELGDLEEVWGVEQLQQQLLGLPFVALKLLLQQPGTSVASENTVVYTIQQWYQQQPTSQQHTVEQLQELMWLVRLPHCSPYYISTIMTQISLVTQCFTQAELAAAKQFSSDPFALEVYQEAKSPLLDRFPAWTSGKRPASNKEQAFVWRLPISQLQSAVEEVLQDPAAAAKGVERCSSSHILQGQQLAVKAVVELDQGTSSSRSSSGRYSAIRPLLVDLFLVCQQLPPTAVRKVSARFIVKAAAAAPHTVNQPSTRDIVERLPVSGFSGAQQAWGLSITVGEVSSWEAADKVLRDKQLVHPPGQDSQAEPHLNIRVEILGLQ